VNRQHLRPTTAPRKAERSIALETGRAAGKIELAITHNSSSASYVQDSRKAEPVWCLAQKFSYREPDRPSPREQEAKNDS